MIFIGDPNIDFEKIEKISSVEDITNTNSSSTVLFDFDFEILKHCNSNDVKSAVVVSNITEALYTNAFNARYIITNISNAKAIQEIANEYMFDSKILTIIESSKEIESVALQGIDGVIYKDMM